jgi:hypothetical protein
MDTAIITSYISSDQENSTTANESTTKSLWLEREYEATIGALELQLTQLVQNCEDVSISSSAALHSSQHIAGSSIQDCLVNLNEERSQLHTDEVLVNSVSAREHEELKMVVDLLAISSVSSENFCQLETVVDELAQKFATTDQTVEQQIATLKELC